MQELLRKEALNLLIGGHYNFPETPNEFALNSLRKCNEHAQKENTKVIAFINDIGFTNFCNHGICDIPFQSMQNNILNISNEISIDELIKLDLAEMKRLDKYLCVSVPSDFISKIYDYKNNIDSLKQYLDAERNNLNTEPKDKDGLNLSSIYYLYLSFLEANPSNATISWAIDYFVYHNNKNLFYPSSFEKINKGIDIYLEKSIYNYSSKILRKLNKKGELPVLELIRQEEIIEYQCKDFEGQNITLRTEKPNGVFNANNKCPLLIATFYFQLLRDYSKENENININIVYMIPSYDRVRVNKGTEVFFNLYLPYLKKNFKINITEINNVYWVSDNCDSFIVDTYRQNNHSIKILS